MLFSGLKIFAPPRLESLGYRYFSFFMGAHRLMNNCSPLTAHCSLSLK
jgi:hypothetical protein